VTGKRGDDAMRRFMFCGVATLLAVLVSASPALAAARDYRGRTAANGDIRMHLVRRSDDPALWFREISIVTRNRGWTCNPGFSDPTDQVIQHIQQRDATYLGADGAFRLLFAYDVFSLRVVGTLGRVSGEGRFRMDFHDESGCTTGSVPWTAIKLRRT
jgi:hypothetical protein